MIKYLQCNLKTQVENIPTQHLQYAGDGFGLNGVAATYNTGGVYEIRLGETTQASKSGFGGDGYVTTTNAAQDGNTTQITLAAVTDTTSKWCVCWYGIVHYRRFRCRTIWLHPLHTYNDPSKIATIKKFR